MKKFTYDDYLRYVSLKRYEANEDSVLREPSAEYKLDRVKVNKPHDKIFKIVLSEKKEVVGLLNRVLKISQEILEEDIERYSTEHIDFLFQKSESDIVYKMKQREIFFLIEHQRTIDYNMPKRILEYEVEIIKEATKGKIMTKKHHKLPSVIPIVIYTGSGKWNVEKYIQECQEVLQGANKVKLGEYYVLDANDYTNEDLEKDTFFFSKMLLLEKLEKEEEIVQALSKIIENEKGKDNKLILKRIITLIMKGKLSFQNIEMLYNKLEEHPVINEK